MTITRSVIINGFVCSVLLRPSMRNATSVLLVGAAISDTLTSLLPAPCYVVFYAFGRHADWIPFSWCRLWHYTTEHLPAVTHAASVWLTVALAAQCYVHVRHAGAGTCIKCLSTVPNVLRVIVVVYVLAFLMTLPRLLDRRYHSVRLTSRVDPGTTGQCHCHALAVMRSLLTRVAML